MVAARIQLAQAGDLPEPVRIYNHFVMTSHCTFDIEPVTVEGRRTWLSGFSREVSYRLFVADTGSQLAGCTSSKEFRVKPAYRAMQSAKQPAWLSFVNPVIGAFGVMLGARFKRTA